MAQKKAKKALQKALEEESTSDSSRDESFQTLETDPNITDYNIEVERSVNRPSTSQQAAAMVRRSPKKQPKLVNKSNRPGTSKQAQAESQESSSEDEQETSRGTLTRSQQQAAAAQANASSRPVGAARRKQNAPAPRRNPKLASDFIGSQIPKAAFSRLVRYIVHKFSPTSDYRVTKECLEALQAASEIYITAVLSDAYQITICRKQVTLSPRDVNVLMYLRGPGSKLGC